MTELYEATEPFDSGQLDVGQGHRLYWETLGNPKGKTAVILHGGPGSGCTLWHRRLLDPRLWRVVLFDQRNCGRSTPHAGLPEIDLTTNTTHRLVADIEALRTLLGVDHWLVLGGSWGSTLALAYAEQNYRHVSEVILFAVTAGLKREFDLVFRGGLASRFPAAWKRLEQAVLPWTSSSGDIIEAVHRMVFDPDPAVRCHGAHEWCLWESATPSWPPTTKLQARFEDPLFALGFTRIVTHYVLNYAWLKDGELVTASPVLRDTPCVLIDGIHDPQTTATAKELSALLPRAEHVIVDGTSHSATNVGISSAIVKAGRRLSVDQKPA